LCAARSYGSSLLAPRPRGRDLGLIDESGRLAVQLRFPRAITSVCVADGALVLAAGALICLEIDGLSPLTRTFGQPNCYMPVLSSRILTCKSGGD
jgi:hypothetical protein